MEKQLIQDLMEAGVQWGHRIKRWNPKMAPYVYAREGGIHIVDLRKTIRGLLQARKYLQSVAQQGGRILFVGTKPQAGAIIEREASRCGMPFVSQHWLEGTLTDAAATRTHLSRMEHLEQLRTSSESLQYSRKLQTGMDREYRNLHRDLNGLRTLDRLPDCMVVIDPKREQNAILEARRLGIQTVALLDTNCDPDEIDIAIPGNDDDARSIEIIVRHLADAIRESQGSTNERSIEISDDGPIVLDPQTTRSALPSTREFPDVAITRSAEATPHQILFDRPGYVSIDGIYVPVRQADAPRYVSAGIEEDEWPLVIGRQYRFYVTIGSQRLGALGGGLLPEPDWGSHTRLDLLICAYGSGLKFSPQTQNVTLYKTGPEPTVHFQLEATAAGSRIAWVMITLARELTLLQEYELTIAVAETLVEAAP